MGELCSWEWDRAGQQGSYVYLGKFFSNEHCGHCDCHVSRVRSRKFLGRTRSAQRAHPTARARGYTRYGQLAVPEQFHSLYRTTKNEYLSR